MTTKPVPGDLTFKLLRLLGDGEFHSGEALAGVMVPRTAIVRFHGDAWVYVQTGADTFERVAIALDHPLADGWFVRAGLKPQAKVVTTGAQQLLSEELKGQIE